MEKPIQFSTRTAQALSAARNTLCICLGLAATWQSIAAQSDVMASGGEGTGNGGTVSYSVGQVAYTQYTGAGGSVNEGVQQAYSVTELNTENDVNASFNCEVYPNPTFSGVKLLLPDHSFQDLNIDLLDISGKVLLLQSLPAGENYIQMSHLPSGTYILRVFAAQTMVQSFKIIKH